MDNYSVLLSMFSLFSDYLQLTTLVLKSLSFTLSHNIIVIHYCLNIQINSANLVGVSIFALWDIIRLYENKVKIECEALKSEGKLMQLIMSGVHQQI